MRLCFIGDDPVVGALARALSARHEVVIAGTPEEVERARFDVAIADGWRSTARLFAVPAERYVRHVASIEHRALPVSSPDRIPAALSLDLPLDFVAESDGLAGFLRMLRPEARVAVVLPPVGSDGAALSADGRALRIAIAGNEDLGRAVVEAMTSPREVVREGADFVLALGEPHEPARTAAIAAGSGAALVVEAGPFSDDLVEHRRNGLLADPDDTPGTARLLDEAARDEKLLAELRNGVAQRRSSWPQADGAAAELERVLESFLAEPPPADVRWPGRLMGDAIAHAAEIKNAIDATHGAIDMTNPLHDYVTKLESELEAIRAQRAYQAATRFRSVLRRRAR